MWQAITLTLSVASLVTLILVVLSLLLAIVLRRDSWFSHIASSLIFIPMVLPPAVLGFYILLFLGPEGPLAALGITGLAFSFEGVLLASLIYSFPFVYFPISNAMGAVSEEHLQVAATMGAGPFDRFLTVVLPGMRKGLLVAAILGFAHTLGEFGVVLIIGGNIPGETQLLSLLLYEYVELGDYESAHQLAFAMFIISFVCLLFVQRVSIGLFAPANLQGLSQTGPLR